MNKIFKYELPCVETHVIKLPAEAQILRVEDVDGKFWLWAIVNVDEDHPKEKRYLEFYKTGQPFKSPPDDLTFLGICKLYIMQELALYVFENINPPPLWSTETNQK
jgi:hypothetical protein